MAAIAAQVHGDAICAGKLAHHRRGNNTWFWSTARLAHSSDVIDVYVESGGHWIGDGLITLFCILFQHFFHRIRLRELPES